MREIKFRVWDGHTQSFFDANGTHYHPKLKIDENGIMRIIPKDESYVILQYTGLKDKNGVEIYEGDILRYKVLYTKNWFSNWKISFGEYVEHNPSIKKEDMTKCFGFYLTNSYERSKPMDYNFFEEDRFEVIGNIKENPELLQELK